ncbi:MAG: hypothetical protein JEZ14_22975 [Marinilabiliaceae bacterium]|nr:hypothetical protein [Marinilabiliaceae bacterium]
MQRYLEQLIEDIHRARTIVQPPSEVWDSTDMDDEGEIEDMVYAETYLYGKRQPLSQITGIQREQLPNADLLTPEQAASLTKELEALLLHHNFVPDFPESFPMAQRYPFLLTIWTNEYVELSFGEYHIEFCDLEEDNCPFPGYCTICNEVAQQMKYDEETGTKTTEEDDRDLDDMDFNDLILPF